MSIKVLYFTSDNCGPCKEFKDQWKQLSKKSDVIEDVHALGSEITFKKIKYEKNKEPFTEHKIKSFPTIVIFVNGERKETLVGLSNVKKIDKVLEKYIC